MAVLLAIMSIVTSVGAYYWLMDPKTAVVSLPESLLNHIVFVIAALLLCKYSNTFLYYTQMLTKSM